MSGSVDTSDASAVTMTPVDDAGPPPDASYNDTETIQTVDIPVAANSELVKCQKFQEPVRQGRRAPRDRLDDGVLAPHVRVP